MVLHWPTGERNLLGTLCTRFGLVHVDFDSKKRLIKDNGKAFAEWNATKRNLMAPRSGKRKDVAQ